MRTTAIGTFLHVVCLRRSLCSRSPLSTSLLAFKEGSPAISIHYGAIPNAASFVVPLVVPVAFVVPETHLSCHFAYQYRTRLAKNSGLYDIGNYQYRTRLTNKIAVNTILVTGSSISRPLWGILTSESPSFFQRMLRGWGTYGRSKLRAHKRQHCGHRKIP